MKKGFLLFIILASILVFTGQTQAQTDKKNIIKINYLSPAISTISMFYEREVSDMISLQLGGLYTFYKLGDVKFSGFAITPEMRIYLSDKGTPEGFFLAPFVRYQNFDLEDTIDPDNITKGNLTTIGGGLLLGGQWIFKDVISVDIWGGPAYLSGEAKVTEGTGTLDIGSAAGFTFRFGTTIGVAF